MVTIYLACYMTGRAGSEIWDEAIRLKQFYEKHGINVITPVDGEDIPNNRVICGDRSDAESETIWKKKDKEKIRQANVFVYPGGKRSSQGIMDEYRLARGTLWKPCVGIFQEVKPGFITRRETDYVATTHEEAALVIKARWGTWRRRFVWRLAMLNRSLPKFVWLQVKELFR